MPGRPGVDSSRPPMLSSPGPPSSTTRTHLVSEGLGFLFWAAFLLQCPWPLALRSQQIWPFHRHVPRGRPTVGGGGGGSTAPSRHRFRLQSREEVRAESRPNRVPLLMRLYNVNYYGANQSQKSAHLTLVCRFAARSPRSRALVRTQFLIVLTRTMSLFLPCGAEWSSAGLVYPP